MTSTDQQPSTAYAFAGLLIAAACAKFWIAAALPLFGDEAFYWLESEHLRPAYDDVPVLTPWLIHIGTSIGGNSEWAVRLPFMLLSLLTVALVVRLASSLGTTRDGWLAGLLALLLPLFASNGLLAVPDVPLTFAIVVCADGLRRFSQGERFAAFMLGAGLCVGWLSHYRFAVPFFAVGVCLLATPLGRQQLRKWPFWAAGLLGSALGLAPLLWHQFAEAGSGFAFQFADRHPWRFQLMGMADLPLQAVVATPLLFFLLIAALWRGAWNQQRADIAVVSGAGLSILAAYLVLGPFVDIERSRLHWPLPALVIGAVVAPLFLRQVSARWRWLMRGGVALAAATLGAAAVCVAALTYTPAQLADGGLYLYGFTGWREAGTQTKSALSSLPADTLVVADHFTLAAELAFALDGRQVYSLDHVINTKHGRQGVLGRMQLDERALFAGGGGRPVLVIAEQSATSLRQRPAWFRRLCELFPNATPRFEVNVDHGRKRLIGYFQPANATDAAPPEACIPPALGYLATPAAGSHWAGHVDIEGWAIRDHAGLVAVRARFAGQGLTDLEVVPSPSVRNDFPGSDDPRHPNVGFVGHLTSDLPAGTYWLEIEVEGHDGVRSMVASMPIYWQPAD